MKDILIIIDPQKDFIDAPDFKGSLAVPGAYDDMKRIIQFIEEKNPKDILVTLDTHYLFDISLPLWWVNDNGEHPTPFTLITSNDVINGTWKATDENLQEHALFYVKQLEKQKKYDLTIWPNHCIIDSEGHKINDELKIALSVWETTNNSKVTYLYKGMNHKTEHYSALKAEVLIDNEDDTFLQKDVIDYISKFDEINISGEASSHCVKGTTLDLIDNLKLEYRKKVNVISNLMSPVPGFENNQTLFFEEVVNKGSNVINFSYKNNNSFKI